MSIYDGVVTLDQEDIQVILGVDEDKIRLSAGGLEIGEWSPEDCSIDEAGDGVFTITAENETLTFTPSNPMTFTAAMNGGITTDRALNQVEEPLEQVEVPSEDTSQMTEAKPLTMVLFYGLAAVTGVLGIWALVSIIF